MRINPLEMLRKMERRIEFSEKDKSILQCNADWAKEIAPEMANHFYTFLGQDEEMNAILNETEGRIHRLHQTFIEWFDEMFTGIDNWSEQYANRRWKIGLVHVRIGIGPQHVVPAMAAVVRAMKTHIKKDSKDESLQEALSKICMIDLAFIEQAYIDVSSEAVLNETGWTEKLFRRLIEKYLVS